MQGDYTNRFLSKKFVVSCENVMPHRLTLSAAPVLLSPPFFARAYIVLGYFPHPPSASNIAPENHVCKGENKDVFITTLFSEFTKNR